MLQPAQRTRIFRGQAGGSSWEMVTRPPGERLQPYVHGNYVGYTERTDALSRRREFAVPFVVLILEFGPPISILPHGDSRLRACHPGGFVGGLDDRFAVCEHLGFQQGVQVNFTPIGARQLFGIPMSELSGRIVSIRDVLPARHRNLAERLQEIADWDERFDVLERSLADCLAEAQERTNVVAWAVRRIEQSGGTVDVRALARQLGYSQRHVIAMFRDQVGIPPKLLARIIRFHRLVKHLRSGRGGTWADLALEFGYYDQSHLVRDVRQFTGITPTAVRPLVTDIYSLLS
jgi:AraC-like DNA-binding protein